LTSTYYVGAISGTSMDGVDAVLLEVGKGNILKVVQMHSLEIPRKLKITLSELCLPSDNEIDQLGSCDVELGRLTALCCNQLIEQAGLKKANITAIGSHGQTIRHRPLGPNRFSMQIGNASVIAENTGITTVADFRMADMACGGQGAPLVPAFHRAAFAHESSLRLVINLGGISNITTLPPKSETQAGVSGYDIGPANGLMDRWIEKHQGLAFDKSGNWARSGRALPNLLQLFLSDPFFALSGPKSTGREYFNLDWLNGFLRGNENPEDVQRTLLELNVSLLKQAVMKESPDSSAEVYFCGGGAYNNFLIERVQEELPSINVLTTDALGIPVQAVEGAAFAWLAKQAINNMPGNIKEATGATKEKILGGIYPA
jgi:anhydro-N-acetylmuramic acid kinase